MILPSRRTIVAGSTAGADEHPASATAIPIAITAAGSWNVVTESSCPFFDRERRPALDDCRARRAICQLAARHTLAP
jgi:hypothetical protein